jgi:glycine/D-amino acid oxidase-like deaminating enzyme/nitrite reductase/ring-hydroxylating ferredoxin subunit
MRDFQSTSDGDAQAPTESVWSSTTPETSYSPLPGDRDVDVAVVGGGITGLTAAAALSEAGTDVAVVEADRIVRGVTGKTTAKLTAQHGLVYDGLRSTHDDDLARQYAESNQRAIDAVEARAERYDVDCDFARTDAYTYTTDPDRREKIADEVSAARAFDLPAEYVEDVPLPADAEAAIRVEAQARFHPRQFLLGLAEALAEDGTDIYERTEAADVEAGDRPHVETDRGTVTANSVLVTTNFPFLDHRLFFSRLYPHRSYVLAVRADDAPTTGMYYRENGSTRSIRSHAAGEEDLFLLGGEGHETGQADSAERYERLEAYARDHFEVTEIPYRWSTQDYSTPDSVPFVGRLGPTTDDVFVATGFGGWGMTNGTAAGELLADLALGRENPSQEVYDPKRLSMSGARRVLEENAGTAREFVEGWVDGLGTGDTATPPPGEARVVRRDGTPHGIYRDEGGELHVVSAVCTHMDCVVNWNEAEESWDCPCHGSRFDVDGNVLVGPAVDDLPRRSDDD